MKFKKNILFVAFALISSVSCSKKGTPNATVNKKTIVYVTGNILRAGNLPVATYWRDGVEIALTDSLENISSVATGIAVNDTDVYIAGAVNGFATYWKNGKAVTLSGSFSYANGIAVSGNDIYVAGNSGTTPVYWKNGKQVVLDSGGGAAYADAIAVVGNDVYIAGNYLNGGSDSVIYWKNGVLTAIASSPSGYATFYANIYDQGWVNIAVKGNDVYITGAAPGHLTAEYWKNGVSTYLVNEPTVTSVLNSININGSDVYTAGRYYLSAAYWKNGTMNILPGGPVSNIATAIEVNGSDIYIAGFEGVSPNSKAIYWKNGTLVALSKNAAITTGIAIVQY